MDADAKIVVSFSGGKTSAYMAHHLIEKYGKDRCVFVFANTGNEHPKTLEFVHACDQAWGLNLVWLEALVDPRERVGTSYTITDYESASRAGEPFKDVCRKYGLPNMKYLHCTRELKERPITKWMKDQPWYTNHHLAIGMRADEIDRINLVTAKVRHIIYPLADAGIRRPDVEKFWKEQPFTLDIPDYMGNCLICFKKTDRKLFTIASEYLPMLTLAAEINLEFRHVKSEQGRNLYRKNRTIGAIIQESIDKDYEKWTDPYFHNTPFDADLDVGGGCGESCEVFSDDI